MTWDLTLVLRVAFYAIFIGAVAVWVITGTIRDWANPRMKLIVAAAAAIAVASAAVDLSPVDELGGMFVAVFVLAWASARIIASIEREHKQSLGELERALRERQRKEAGR